MDTWQLFRRLGTRYQSDYDAPTEDHLWRKDASTLPLDEVLVAGQANMEVLAEVTEKYPFSHSAYKILTDAKYAKDQVWTHQEERPAPSLARVTASKWNGHLASMVRTTSSTGARINPILVPCAIAMVIMVCTYFAVPKDDQVARTIFNGKDLSMLCTPPPSVNLMDIPTLLLLTASYRGLSYHFMDIRHWFHQLPVNSFLRQLFVIRDASGQFLSWQVLPMGWSWSPYIAQCIAWSLVLYCGTRKRTREPLFELELPKDCASPPQFVRIRRVSDEADVGFVTILYDNIGVFCCDSTIGIQVRDRLLETAYLCNIAMKYSRSSSAKQASITLLEGSPSEDIQKRFADCVYRGIQFGVRRSRTVWRCNPEKTARWQEGPQPQHHNEVGVRIVAAWVGFIIWFATVTLTPLCQLKVPIDILRRVGSAAHSMRWDAARILLTLEEASSLNHWLALAYLNEWTCSISLARSLIPYFCATDASDEGYGFVELTRASTVFRQEARRWQSNLQTAHIFLRELAVAIWWIRWAVKEGHRHIVIGVDNTGAVGALRKMFSTNSVANEWLIQLSTFLKGKDVFLRVIPVPTKLNCADHPSHLRNCTMDEMLATLKIVEDGLEGLRQEPTHISRRAPPHPDTLRHTEETDAEESWGQDLVDEFADCGPSDDEAMTDASPTQEVL